MKIRLVLLFALVAICLPVATNALNLSSTSPNPTSSTPNNSHVFFVRKDPGRGLSPELRLSITYPKSALAGAARNDKTFTISPGFSSITPEVCTALAGRNNDNYLVVRVGTASYPIDRAKVCTEANANRENKLGNESGSDSNILYATYPIPGNAFQADDNTPEFETAKVIITYGNNAPATTGGIRLVVTAAGGQANVGPTGGDDYAFPIIGDWDKRNLSNTSIKVPFGACGAIKVPTRKNVGLYDAERGASGFIGLNIRFKVYNETEGRFERFYSVRNGELKDNDTALWPTEGNKDQASADIVMDPYDKYYIQVLDIDPRNAIDVKLPYQSFYGDSSSCSPPGPAKYNINGISKLNGSTSDQEVEPGEPVTFTHDLTNVGAATSPVIGSVYDLTGSSTVIGQEFKANPAFGAGITRNNIYSKDFIIPGTAENGNTFCQRIRWNPDSFDRPVEGVSDPVCAVVSAAPLPQEFITITPKVNVTGAGDVETGTPAEFTGYATVSNFPKPEKAGWGYSEIATAKPANRLAASPTGATRRVCPAGYTPSNASVTNCQKNGAREAYCDPSPGDGHGGFNLDTFDGGGPACSREFDRYRNNGTLTCSPGTRIGTTERCRQKIPPMYRTPVVYAAPITQTYQQCPNGGSGSGYASPGSSVQCNVWQCPYAGAAVVNSNTAPSCGRICSSTGQPPYNASKGDYNCYIKPEFTITCKWSDGLTSPPETVTYDKGSGYQYCKQTRSYPVTLIGTSVTVRYDANKPTSWSHVGPIPGTIVSDKGYVRLAKRWSWNEPAEATATARAVGKPYLKVYGGDVRVGGGVKGEESDLNTCPAADKADIITQRRRDNMSENMVGAGTQGAAFANGTIDGFVSGQYNSLYEPRPKALSFANTDTDNDGGAFTALSCTAYLTKIMLQPGASEIARTTTTLPVSTISDDQILYHKGDLFIENNVVYNSASGSWTTLDNIPLLQLVVEGDIYIKNTVTQLDGLYAAVKKADNSVGGNIYTCSTGIGTSNVPTGTFDTCARQLIVNGALSANKIHFLRDCGSLKESYSANNTLNTESSVLTGSLLLNKQRCSATNAAAEIFNYTPEQWIRSGLGKPDTKYDAISSLPPVL